MASILVVDSSSLMRNTVAQRLRKIGYTVHGAADPAEAMELLVGVHVDLLVLELELQRGCGVELLRGVRRDPHFRVMPVIVYTHVDDEKLTRPLAQLKVAGLLHKDRSDFCELSHSIERLLSRGSRRPRQSRGSRKGAKRSPKVAGAGHNGSHNGHSRPLKHRPDLVGRRHGAR